MSNIQDRLFGYCLLGTGFGVYLFYKGFKRMHLKRLIEDIPTSNIRSIAIGPVEVRGEAVPIFKIFSPFGRSACAYYRYRVQEYRRSRHSGHWVTIARGDSSQYPFFLEDGTGCALVNPLQAEMDLPWIQAFSPGLFSGIPPEAKGFLDEKGIAYKGWLGSSKKIRLEESYIMPRQPIYVLGYAAPWKMEANSAGAERLRSIKLQKELLRLKRDKTGLMKYDSNHDGKIDAEEWEKAKQRVLDEVKQEEILNVRNMTVIRQSPDGGIFYVSDKSQKELIRHCGMAGFGGVFGGACLSLICLAYILFAFGLF